MRARAAAGSLLFLVVAPGVVAGLVPWWLTGWEAGDGWPVLSWSIIVGEALVLARPVLFVWAVVFALAVGAFVRGYEEPTLGRQFGDEYERYRRAVPGWWPRRKPWHGG